MSENKVKVVIVAGQRFSVAAGADNETVRQQLLTMGFADVASAEAKAGTDADGNETVEFVKKAGTKGLEAADLAGLLAQVPPASLDRARASAQAVAARLLDERLTFGEALAEDAGGALALVAEDGGECSRPTTKGARLCAQLVLPAAPAPVVGW